SVFTFSSCVLNAWTVSGSSPTASAFVDHSSMRSLNHASMPSRFDGSNPIMRSVLMFPHGTFRRGRRNGSPYTRSTPHSSDFRHARTNLHTPQKLRAHV